MYQLDLVAICELRGAGRRRENSRFARGDIRGVEQFGHQALEARVVRCPHTYQGLCSIL